MRFNSASAVILSLLGKIQAQQLEIPEPVKYTPSEAAAPKEYDYGLLDDIEDSKAQRLQLSTMEDTNAAEILTKYKNGYFGQISKEKRALATDEQCSKREFYNSKGQSKCSAKSDCMGDRICKSGKCWGNHGCDATKFESQIAGLAYNYGQNVDTTTGSYYYNSGNNGGSSSGSNSYYDWKAEYEAAD